MGPVKTAAVIAEFNPLHDGHRYLIRRAREAGFGHIAVIMSGNFVQRGEPAVYPKAFRARKAIEAGADLVVSLPLPWAMSGTDSFARGGMQLALAIGADALVFGSESGDADLLARAARLCRGTEFSLDGSEKMTYAKAFFENAKLIDPEAAELFCGRNDTLGAAYVAQLAEACAARPEAVPLSGGRSAPVLHCPGSALGFVPVKRAEGFDGATLIREKLFSGVLEPEAPVYDRSRLDLCVLASLRGSSAEELQKLPYAGGGIGTRLFSAAKTETTFDGVCLSAKSKNVTLARVKRTAMRCFLGISRDYTVFPVPYCRVLDANENGKELLRRVSLPVVFGYPGIKKLPAFAREVYDLEMKADSLYELLF
ncbi:MAG: nucleotidyltransferase family protein [Clostridia bacterium]|nr:nucleotidyltransferase family protein [Clostridia bacterium]